LILNFSDLHFGCKTHSQQLPSGYVTTEEVCIDICEQLLVEAAKPEIKMIIFSGDLCHTNHPTTLVIDYLISFFKRLDELGKPVIGIPGNHDASNYAHSFIFLRQLGLKHLFIYDDLNTPALFNTDLYKTKIYLLPFVFGSNPVNKYNSVREKFEEILNSISPDEKAIVVSHFQESSCSTGSESSLVSKSVESIDIDCIIPSGTYNVMCLLGHIHMHQYYKKLNGINVVYPGSPYPIDKADCNQQKGFIIVDPDEMAFQFKPLKQLRNFIKYTIPSSTSILDFFSKVRISKDSFIFVDKEINSDTECENIDIINQALQAKQSTCVSIKYIRKDIQKMIVSTVEATSINASTLCTLFKQTVEQSDIPSTYDEQNFKTFLNGTYEFISKASDAYYKNQD